MRTSKRGLEVVGEEGGEAWKEVDPWPPVQSDSEEMRKLRRRQNHLDIFVNWPPNHHGKCYQNLRKWDPNQIKRTNHKNTWKSGWSPNINNSYLKISKTSHQSFWITIISWHYGSGIKLNSLSSKADTSMDFLPPQTLKTEVFSQK